jgi:membrane protein involved in colicin uptake
MVGLQKEQLDLTNPNQRRLLEAQRQAIEAERRGAAAEKRAIAAQAKKAAEDRKAAEDALRYLRCDVSGAQPC